MHICVNVFANILYVNTYIYINKYYIYNFKIYIKVHFTKNMCIIFSPLFHPPAPGGVVGQSPGAPTAASPRNLGWKHPWLRHVWNHNWGYVLYRYIYSIT